MDTLIKFPNGDEATLDEWKETPQAKPEAHDEPDKFVEWEARRSFCHLMGHLGFAQNHENT